MNIENQTIANSYFADEPDCEAVLICKTDRGTIAVECDVDEIVDLEKLQREFAELEMDDRLISAEKFDR